MKVGRNDPCPCGSGKKHKHCFLAREERAAPSSRADGVALAIDCLGQRHRKALTRRSTTASSAASTTHRAPGFASCRTTWS